MGASGDLRDRLRRYRPELQQLVDLLRFLCASSLPFV